LIHMRLNRSNCYRAVQHLEFHLIGDGLAEDIYFAHLGDISTLGLHVVRKN